MNTENRSYFTYTPAPIDTSDVIVPSFITALCERLAENTHENFVRLRLAQGWKYGPERNDTLKTNPTLLPYDLLPDSEKEYDRVTSMETIKTILALGYTISVPENS